MIINSDINILGGLPDFNLIIQLFYHNRQSSQAIEGKNPITTIKTTKSLKRFKKSINGTLLYFRNEKIESLVNSFLINESLSADTLLLLFWNASANNQLLHHLNEQVYFPAYYSGRISLKMEEVAACIRELRQHEPYLQKWSDSTINVTASKYLTLLKKFNLMEGSAVKSIVHPYLKDKLLLVFVYWMLAIEEKPNLLLSNWLKYCFTEKQLFIGRVTSRKFSRFIQFNYTGDRLTIELTETYNNIYHALTKP
jgi:hypothetical protein